MEKITRFFIENYRVTYLVILAIFVFGFIAIYDIPKESSPEVDIPVAVIITPFPGAGTENVEKLITRPIENRVSGISGVERVDSSSRQGLSTIVVQFVSSSDSNEKISEIRNQVERAKTSFPAGVGDPVVQKISFSDVPIMRIVVFGPYDSFELKYYAEELKERIESIKNVSDVIVSGAPEKEIKIKFKEEKLFQYGISAEFISGIIGRENVDFPMGLIKSGENNYAIRLDNELKSIKDVKEFPLIEINGSLIRVEDVAFVEEGYENIDSITRFSSEGNNPETTVSVQLFKESGEGNILTIDNLVKNIIEELKENYLPNDVSIEIIQNEAETIRADLNMLVKSILFTVLIIFLILAFFLGIRDALIASFAVPFSFLITFVFINIFGLTINFLTLFSLVLSLGILVDASIVVTESIFEKRFKGLDKKEASIETVKEFGAPLVAGTLTTVFVFFPMLLLSGVMGEFIKSIPITVSTVLISSLFVSLFLITTIAFTFSKKITNDPDIGLFGIGKKLQDFISVYQKYLSLVLLKKRIMYYFLVSTFVLFLISISFPFIGILPVNMFPSPNADNIFINLEMPAGISIEKTDEKIKLVEDYLIKDNNVESFFTFVGQTARAGSISLREGSNSNIASINVNLKKDRKLKSFEILEKYRLYFKDINEAKIRISQTEAGPGTEGGIQINIIGKDLDEIEKTATLLSETLSLIEGTENVESGIESNAGEFVITLKKELLRIYNISALEIAEKIRTVISGKTITNIRILEDEINVIISSNFVDEEENAGSVKVIDLSDIYYLPIQTRKGIVSLGTFIDIDIEPGRGVINRKDRERIISITSDVSSGFNSSKIISQFKDEIINKEIPNDINITYGGEVDEINRSFRELFYSMIIGIIMIFVLMVLQFRSYKQSFFVLITIPLALIGVIGGLSITRQPLSFPGFIGIVALSGIVVNNAIILIDTINKRHDSGVSLFESIILGAKSRFRPIILTTITTIFGLIPLIFVGPVWAPVAYSIIFGLLFSTVLTLFVIPILYYLFSKEKD